MIETRTKPVWEAPHAKTDPIITVGAGASGLSTAIHLAQRGYSNVTVFDAHLMKSPSMIICPALMLLRRTWNRIIRTAYGEQTEYQDSSTEAIKSWNACNAEISNGECLPDGIGKADKVFINNGQLLGLTAIISHLSKRPPSGTWM